MEANAKWLCEEFVTHSEAETEALGARYAQAALGSTAPHGSRDSVLSGCVILDGPLGAGKTAWVRGFARGWGCSADVSSPTFSLVQEYPGGPAPVYHLDFYRLKNADEVWGLGFEDLLATGWVLVEWGSRFARVFPRRAAWVRFAPEASLRRIRLGAWEPTLVEAPEL